MIVWSSAILVLRWSCFKAVVWCWSYSCRLKRIPFLVLAIFYHKTSCVPVFTEPLKWFASHLRSFVIVFECVGTCLDRPLESSPFALLTAYFIQDMMPSTVKQGAGLQNENYVRLTVSASSRSRSSLQFQTGARFLILLSFSLARCQIFVICSRRGGKASSLILRHSILHVLAFLVANY